MSGAHSATDLLAVDAADLQRALLKVPDELLSQALCAAADDVRRVLLENLSRRRKGDAMRKASRLESSGEISLRSANAALHNLVRNVFDVTSPEQDATRAEPQAANARKQRSATHTPCVQGKVDQAADLSEASFNYLCEARGVVSSFEGLSHYSTHLKTCGKGRAGAVLLKNWLGKKPAIPREKIYGAICGQAEALPGASAT